MHRSRLFARLGPILISVLAQGCASVSAHGIVRTSDGGPVVDASVTLTEPETGRVTARSSSDPRGCFSVYEPVEPGDRAYVLRISSPGRKPIEIVVRMQEAPLLFVTLAGEASSDESAARPVVPRERGSVYEVPCALAAVR
jgi:hypothetical protein